MEQKVEAVSVEQKFVKLVSNDGIEFTAPINVLMASPVLAKMVQGPFKESQLVFE